MAIGRWKRPQILRAVWTGWRGPWDPTTHLILRRVECACTVHWLNATTQSLYHVFRTRSRPPRGLSVISPHSLLCCFMCGWKLGKWLITVNLCELRAISISRHEDISNWLVTIRSAIFLLHVATNLTFQPFRGSSFFQKFKALLW